MLVGTLWLPAMPFWPMLLAIWSFFFLFPYNIDRPTNTKNTNLFNKASQVLKSLLPQEFSLRHPHYDVSPTLSSLSINWMKNAMCLRSPRFSIRRDWSPRPHQTLAHHWLSAIMGRRRARSLCAPKPGDAALAQRNGERRATV
jgi:hypothetical protein